MGSERVTCPRPHSCFVLKPVTHRTTIINAMEIKNSHKISFYLCVLGYLPCAWQSHLQISPSPVSQLLGKGPAAHPKQASLPPAFPPGVASRSSCWDDSRGPLAGPGPSPAPECHVLNSKGRMPGWRGLAPRERAVGGLPSEPAHVTATDTELSHGAFVAILRLGEHPQPTGHLCPHHALVPAPPPT